MEIVYKKKNMLLPQHGLMIDCHAQNVMGIVGGVTLPVAVRYLRL